MSSQTYKAQDIVELLHQQTDATLPEIKAVLGTTSGDTAHRKLAAVGGCTSHSHR